MKEQIIEVVGDKLEKLNVWIDDVYTDKEGTEMFVHIVLDSEEIIPLNVVVMATRKCLRNYKNGQGCSGNCLNCQKNCQK